ncbi:MAG TPA: hypothetical protein VF556_08805 [Pyrinomonadaceae bacterium]
MTLDVSQFSKRPFLRLLIVLEGRKSFLTNNLQKNIISMIYYPTTPNAGKNKNIKIRVNFFVEDLSEWIEITKVFQTKSIVFIKRDFDKYG